MSIKPGSTVELKSGSPKMMVDSIKGDQVRVKWFNATSLQEQTFHIDMLKPVALNEQILFG